MNVPTYRCGINHAARFKSSRMLLRRESFRPPETFDYCQRGIKWHTEMTTTKGNANVTARSVGPG